jgi:DNA invertase Pin-like site-specific DNA recombinase
MTTTAPPRKNAYYVRQSLDRDRNQLGVSRQRAGILEKCAAIGWDDPVEYCDDNVSARKGSKRPAWDALVRDIADGEIGRLMVWDDDRLRRTVRDGEDFIDLAETHIVELANVDTTIDLSTPMGQAMFRMKGTMAQFEMQHKSKRQKAANEQRARRGKSWVSRPFGYTRKVDKDEAVARAGERAYNIAIFDEKLTEEAAQAAKLAAETKRAEAWNPVTDSTDDEIVEYEADAIRKACRDLLNGSTLWSIAKEWNAAGLKTSRGCDWAGTSVRQMLLRPRNAGLQVYDGAILEGVTPAWPAIVDRTMWDGVVALLADPKRFTGKSPGRKYLLSGIAFCGECNRRMGTTVRALKSGGNRPVYQCKNMGCMKIVRDLAETDRLVVDIITGRLAEPDAAEAFARPSVDVAALTAEANALHKLIANTKDEYNEGLIDARDRNARIDRLNEKLAVINDKVLPVHMSRDIKKLAGNPHAAEEFEKLPTLDRKRGVIDTVAVVTVHRQEKKGGRFDPRAITVVGKQPS